MKGKKILYAGIAILILGIGFAVGTYAYYQTTITGTASGTVLAWNCTANNLTADFTVGLGALYPGASGAKSIRIASSISSNYSISFGNFVGIGAGSAHPNLNLYTTHSGGTSYSGVINGSSKLEGSVAAGGYTDATFYYYWPYGTTSEDYVTTAPSVKLTVVCTQT